MNDYFCILPFYSVETEFSNPNKNIYCCRLPPNTNIENVRDSIRNKQRSVSCSTCWNLEHQGLKSERQVHNEMLDYYLNSSIENIESRALTNGFDPLKIKLATSNTCNGLCVTCNSNFSSAWASLENNKSKYVSINFDQIDFNIEWSKIVALSFVGGEPFLEKKNFQILERLIELENTKCFISIVTNGSVPITNDQLKILERFQNLNICLSIDGIGSTFEYMRYPLKWDLFLSNFAVFKNLTNILSVSAMISNLNVYYYSDIIDFFKEQNIDYLCKQITDPNYFSPSNLPQNIKGIVQEKNQKYLNDVCGFLNVDNSYSELNFLKLKEEIQRQDRLKNISIMNFIPEIARLIIDN